MMQLGGSAATQRGAESVGSDSDGAASDERSAAARAARPRGRKLSDGDAPDGAADGGGGEPPPAVVAPRTPAQHARDVIMALRGDATWARRLSGWFSRCAALRSLACSARLTFAFHECAAH